jgi:hypothetical protein
LEIVMLAAATVAFIALAHRLLAYLERLSRIEGRLTVMWQ